MNKSTPIHPLPTVHCLPFRRPIRHGGAGERRDAFALIIALSLMAFILLLLLSMTTFVRVETSATAIRTETLKARQNALFGLKVALGELQRAAGPDRRATATAGLLDKNPDSESFDGVEHPHWTGVWNPDEPDEPDNPTWLVSSANAEDPPNPTQALGGESAVLVGADSAVTPVEAGIVSFDTDGTGSFAWWIGDEGVKAKINTVNPYLDSDASSEERALSLQAAQRTAIELLNDTSGDFIGDDFDPADSALHRGIRNRRELKLADPDLWNADLRRRLFHDVTVVSEGLLADAADGGLRKDLNLAFEMDLEDFNADSLFADGGDRPQESDYSGRDRPPPAGELEHDIRYVFQETNGPPVKGPTWHLLRNFYRLYKATDPDRAEKENHPGGVRNTATDPIVRARPNYLGNVIASPGYWFDSNVTFNFMLPNRTDVMTSTNSRGQILMTERALAPVMVARQLVLSLEAIEEPKINPNNPTEYRLRLHLDPIETVWNPYTTALEFSELTSGFRFLDLEMEIILDQPDEDQITLDVPLWRVENLRQGGDDTMNLETRLNATGRKNDGEVEQTVRMEPGEVLLFSNIEGREGGSFTEDVVLGPGVGDGAKAIQNNPGVARDRLDPDNELGRNKQLIVEEGTEIQIRLFSGQTGKSLSSPVADVDFGQLHNTKLHFSGNEVHKWAESRPVEDLASGPGRPLKTPLASFRVTLKPENARDSLSFLVHGNPSAGLIHSATQNVGYGIAPDNHDIGLRLVTSWETDLLHIEPDSPRSFWGPSRDAQGVGSIPLLELPTAPLLSLASLQHLTVPMLPQFPAMAIGNAYASPYLPRDQVRHGLSTRRGTRTQIDYSYLLNEALFDRFFFSSLAPRPLAEPGALDIEDVFDDAMAEGGRLPNTRMRLFPSAGETFGDLKNRLLNSDGSPTAEAYERIAENLLIDGAFNVNSTSVEAWKAVLAGTNGTDVDFRGGTLNDADAPLTRYRVPPGPVNQGNKEEEWSGFNTLNPEQIQALAEAVVREVKTRGPFFSLADFVNRRLTTDATGLRGTLQAAIDATDINDGFSQGFRVENESDPSNFDFPDPEAMHGAAAANAPAFLSQSDLLVPLGPSLAVRSDTFVIRTLGTAENPVTGETTARAWIEAVVQRTPGKVDPAEDIAEGDPPGGFGRRFRIIDFRWLHPDEV